MKESINKSPKSAMALYVKIYCQKQAKTNDKQCTLIEATKSWVSLSKADREYFLNVFNEYKTKMRKNFALKLQNVELYMKKKCNPKRSNKITTSAVDCNEPVNQETSINMENGYAIHKDEHKEIEIQQDDEQLENYNNTMLLDDITSVNRELDVPKFISEPTPPVRSAMEFFEIIKHNNESTQNTTWTNLTKLQKQRYQRALLSIKHDYIKQYTAYLEQLTPEQLFHYYKNKM